MPAELSERERLFVPDLETGLKNQGYLLVRHGAGDMQLDFQISEGPINIDTKIGLFEGNRVIAKGDGRAAGAPLIGRSKVAEKSFSRAYEQFQNSLPGTSPGQSERSTRHEGVDAPSDQEYVY